MTAKPHTIEVGSTIGSYRIQKLIGSGGMGKVYEAVHTLLPRHVAIKILHPAMHLVVGMDARMVQEAAILDELRHPGVVRVFDCGLLDDLRPWIAMELVAGESLATRLEREQRLSPVAVCDLVAALADVLATVHPLGIVHRDLKPDNVLFADTDGGCPLRIIDWGVAHLRPALRLTLENVTCGTPHYMSPEQATGRNIAAACDIYSLGVIAYEALAGHPPFDGRTLLEVLALHLNADAPPLSALCPESVWPLCELVHRMLDKRPASRPTATEVRDSIRQLAIEIAASDTEFESYAVTTTPTEGAPTSTRIRWTPEAASCSLPTKVVEASTPRSETRDWEVAGEIRRAH